MVIIFVYMLLRYKFKKNKKRGYTVCCGLHIESMLLSGFMMIFTLTIIFTIFHITGGEDEYGNDLCGHLKLFCVLFYLPLPLYLFYTFKKIYFNKNEIIVTNFLGFKKYFYWENILRVLDRENDKIIVITTKGKFTVDKEFSNTKKFLNILQEKNINVEKIKLFERIKKVSK